MVKSYSEKYGLDPERKKIEAGMSLTVTQIVSIEPSKKMGDDGKPYEIATINGLDEHGQPVKYYATNKAIVDACRQMQADAKPDGTLKEPLTITITEEISDKKRKYLKVS